MSWFDAWQDNFDHLEPFAPPFYDPEDEEDEDTNEDYLE